MKTEHSAEDSGHSDEYESFKKTLNRVLSVPHSVIKGREAEYQEEAAKNPNRRGPKRKAVT